MMTLEWVRITWDYSYWAHHKLLDSLETVSEADFTRDVPYSVGSLQTQVVHTMWAEALWLARLLDNPRPDFTAADYPIRPVIRTKWAEIESQWRAYLDQLSDAELSRSFIAHATRGDYTHHVYEVLMQVVNHGTDHRAQMLRIIADCGGDTFPQDIIYYFREKQH